MKLRECAKKITRWYQELDQIIEGVPRLLRYVIYGFSVLLGFLILIFARARIWEFLGLLIIVLTLIFISRGLIIGISSFYWRVMVKPFFLWILWIRTQGFSVLLTREYGIQLSAALLTGFALHQFRIYRMLPYTLFAIMIILSLFSEDGIEMTSSDWSNFTAGIISLTILVLVTIIPGFFAGFLTGNEGKGKNSVGFGSFLAASIGLVYWAPEIFFSLPMGDWGIFLMVLILIGMTILLLFMCGIGMVCGDLGETLGIHVRRRIFKKFGVI